MKHVLSMFSLTNSLNNSTQLTGCWHRQSRLSVVVPVEIELNDCRSSWTWCIPDSVTALIPLSQQVPCLEAEHFGPLRPDWRLPEPTGSQCSQVTLSLVTDNEEGLDEDVEEEFCRAKPIAMHVLGTRLMRRDLSEFSPDPRIGLMTHW